MPLYDFTCQQGHATERVRPLGTEGIPCPTCGQAAVRSHVHRFDVVGPTVDTRGMFRRYREAVQDLDYRGVDTSGAWEYGKQKANAMLRAGEGLTGA